MEAVSLSDTSKKPQSSQISPGPGFRIKTKFVRPNPALIAKIAEYETPDISDMLNRMYTMSPGIRGISESCRVVGPACTVKVYPGDNLMVHKALDVAQPGDVIVIDTSESYKNAVLGDLVTNKAKHRGVAGFVIDGLVRDIEGIREAGLPVFSRGYTPFGPLHRGPGELNYPISCGGLVVNPGDIISADINGIVVIRQEFAEHTVSSLASHREELSDYIANVKKGIFSNEWVDRLLTQEKCGVDD